MCGWGSKFKIKVQVVCSLLSGSHDRGGGRLCSAGAEHETLGDVITVDLAQRRAQRVDAGAVLARPVGQECTDRMLFLPKGGDPLLLVPQEAR